MLLCLQFNDGRSPLNTGLPTGCVFHMLWFVSCNSYLDCSFFKRYLWLGINFDVASKVPGPALKLAFGGITPQSTLRNCISFRIRQRQGRSM